jgi:hypothetical protein
MCDSECCDEPVGDVLHSVRQIVALYHVNYEKWLHHSINSSTDAEKQTSASRYSRTKNHCNAMGDAKLVELVILNPDSKDYLFPIVCLRPTLPPTLIRPSACTPPLNRHSRALTNNNSHTENRESRCNSRHISPSCSWRWVSICP